MADVLTKAIQYTDPQQAREAGLYPYFVEIEESTGNQIKINGQWKINLGSNNYHGLTHHPEVMKAAQEAIRKYGAGCTGSRFLNGTLDLHVQAEQALAEFVHKPAAVIFPTGYQTNVGIISTLVGPREFVCIDKLVHASIIDGCMQARGTTILFKHNDARDLERQLEKKKDSAVLVVVDGVYSMEGDICRLPDIVDVCKKYGARIMVDDAHALGVLGERGAGTAEHFGLTNKVDLIMATFSKSLASIGGFVASDFEVIDYLKHKARSLIFSASIPPPAIATVYKALEILKREPDRIQRLWDNATYLADNLRKLNFNLGKTESPVIPVIIGEDIKTFKVWRALFDLGVYVNPVIAPAVPPGTARLRVSCIATHEKEELDRALEIFETVGKKFKLI